MDDRRTHGLCFNCPEKFAPGHNKVCKGKGVYTIEISEDFPLEDDASDNNSEPAVEVSMCAMTGLGSTDTFLLETDITGVPITALVDSGSTHTFMASSTVDRLGFSPEPLSGVHVKVANGERLQSSGVCRAVRVIIGGEPFNIDVFVIPLEGYELVLGYRWLRSLGSFNWDCARQRLSFWNGGRRVRLVGKGAPSRPRLAAAVAAIDYLQLLLDSFADLFEPPTTLPPSRSFDHHIHLLPGTAPVAVRPYRYPQLLKDEIERQCADMLRQGIIRPSTSAFSSPVLLVRKKDGAWRFCVDYRALNAVTVRDMFPIPIVDELLDELRGAVFFTKLDLSSGYHQVRMFAADIDKTAFRTHHGHFEFLVMPFGLTNAPSTFQALMNEVLRPFLRRFVLVFFDDILIYSATWTEHLQHVRAVFNVLRVNHLAIKQSKCTFGE